MTRHHLLLLLAWAPLAATAQLPLRELTLSNPENEPLPVHPLPTERQVRWNETEFYAFFHYGMNTYTGLEWGYGNEPESRFAPTAPPNPRQWLQAARSAGMRGGIAVVKHHDGFCLWPTATTDHSVKKAGNAFGRQTNIPRDFAAAAGELGMKYGFYISPWDRNSPHYGQDTYVTEVFLKQCLECAEYGSDQFEMWFDGANGGNGYYGGKDTTVRIDNNLYYDIPNLRARVHRMAPHCVMWGMGGEARWIGNEAGWAGQTNWALIDHGPENPATLPYGQEEGWAWVPGESDAKATSAGWFWHEGESVLSAERLFQMYLETVGRNATLILNLPPDRSGSLPEATVNRMAELGHLLRTRLQATDHAREATLHATTTRPTTGTRTYTVDNLTDGDPSTYWASPDGETSATLTLTWDEPRTIRYLQLMEPIRKGQRVRAFQIEYSPDGRNWNRLAPTVETTTIGYKRIIPLNGSTAASYGPGYRAKALRVSLLDSRDCPLLSNLSVF